MRKAGGIVAVIAGVYGMIAAVFAMILGSGDTMVTRVGWGGILCSFVTIGLGAMAVGDESRGVGVLQVVTSIFGLIWVGGWLFISASHGTMSSGAYVGISMILSLLGGILVASAGTTAE